MAITEPIHILLIEDDEDDFLLTKGLLESVDGQAYRLDRVKSHPEALTYVEDAVADVVLLDYRLGQANGVFLAQQLRDRDYPAPIIMLTGQPDLDVDLEAMKAGSVDFLSKHDLTPQQLERSIRYAIRHARSVRAVGDTYQFLSDYLDALHQRIAILDDRGNILAVNKAWRSSADANGFAGSNHGVGMNYLDVCDRADGRDAFDAIRVADAIRRTANGEDLDFVLEYPCVSDDEESWFAVAVTPYRTPGALRVIVSHEDITRRIIAERELYSVAETMETLMSSSPAAIIGVDEDVRITHWSPAAERIFGWTKDEVLGKVSPLFAESEREEMLAYHQRTLGGEIVVGREVQRLTKDGGLVPVHVSVAPIVLANQKPRGALGIFVDLTARVQIEDELRRQEQQYRALVENLPDIVVRYDRDLRRVYGNAASNALIAERGGAEPGASLAEVGLPPAEVDRWTNYLRRVFQTGEPLDVEWNGPADGSIYETRLVPESAPDGNPESVLVVSRDITDRKRTEDERRFLTEASSRLASTLDLEATLKTLVELLVPRFADVCSVSLFDDGGVPI
ncbi:hypothetical protein BH23CHL2_BH23CHL2_11970 [soil metagenome]